VLFAGPVIANGISQPKPAVSRIGGRRLEFDSKLVIAGREVQAAFDIRARLDGSCSDQGIDIEPPCALNRRPSALSSATRGNNYYDCSFTSLPQCNGSASGRGAQCIINPYYAGATGPQRRYRRYRGAY
jgi:hypothetical protein